MLTLLTLLIPSASAAPPDPLSAVPKLELTAPDPQAEAVEDELRRGQGLPERFAVPHEVHITPDTDGVWGASDDGLLSWRYRVRSPGADSLNFGFTRYALPPGATLSIRAPGRSAPDNLIFDAPGAQRHGQLWTPLLDSDDALLELRVPPALADQVILELGQINLGYRGLVDLDKSGSCNVNVACPTGDDWQDEIAAAGMYSLSGWFTCSGSMINNTSQDETPLFLTAHHCEVTSANAASMVFYWNYESPSCDQRGGGDLSDTQSGATLLATYTRSDFTLVELDERPDPDYQVAYGGWDHSGEDATIAVGIHHPNLDEKAISVEYDGTEVTSYSSYSSPGDGTHIRIVDWDEGTTEGGSSGSPLYNQDHHIIGQLHGGAAACGNNESDWYGGLAVSWEGGGDSSSGLKDWLDPGHTGAASVDTLTPWSTGLSVSGDPLIAEGAAGGPFTPSQATWTVENRGDQALDFEVSSAASWLDLSPSGGALGPGESAQVLGTLSSQADALPNGSYSEAVVFSAPGSSDREITATLLVGISERQYQWTMDEDPGWSPEGAWTYGMPQGLGGSSGSPDPESGYTGDFVYGYNLGGDYDKRMGEEHLVTGAIDCSKLSRTTLRFQRWLGVEESRYDSASLSVSADGQSWVTVWENDDEIDDGRWVAQEIDISEVADGQPQVTLRWTMGPTDQGLQFCGWNLDDVEIWGVGEDAGAGGEGGGEGGGQGGGQGGDEGSDTSGYASGSASAESAESTGGCGCAAAPGPGAAGWLLGLASLLLARRRR